MHPKKLPTRQVYGFTFVVQEYYKPHVCVSWVSQIVYNVAVIPNHAHLFLPLFFFLPFDTLLFLSSLFVPFFLHPTLLDGSVEQLINISRIQSFTQVVHGHQ